MKRERLEDLGVLREKLDLIREMAFFENCTSKHGFEEWIKQWDEEDKLYDIHMKIRHIKDRIDDCYFIACGDNE